jgi:hypothetical protein
VTVGIPVRIDIAKRVIRQVFRNAAGELAADRFVWEQYDGTPRPPRPYVMLTLVSGPTGPSARREGAYRAAKDDATFTILTATVGRKYRARVNGIPGTYVAQAGDDVTAIRDGLQAALTAELDRGMGEPVSVASSGVDAFIVTPDSPGELMVASSENADTDVDVSITESSTTCVMYRIGRSLINVQASAFTAGAAAEYGAPALIDRLHASLDLESSMDYLREWRIGARSISDPIPLVQLEGGGGTLAGQSAFELELITSSVTVEEVVPIESVDVTINTGTPRTFTIPTP